MKIFNGMKQWQIKTLQNPPKAHNEYPYLIMKLLALRGIYDELQIQEFLNPDYAKLHDPFKFKDMEKAIKRIWLAIEKKEKITIYADYDADAITAAAVVFLGLKKLGIAVDCYIPDRFSEGYGMNLEAVRSIAKNGTKLIITVDCGTNAVEEAELCKELGLDLIITDHHEITGELPKATALINPKNPNDQYPYPYLTGVGVAYKLVQALFSVNSKQKTINRSVDGWEKWLLDLVAIGTVADLQALTDENRILVSFGLKVLQKTRWPGLKALLEVSAQKPGLYDSFTLGFILAPRINAAGRIQHGNTAFKLLVAENITEAKELADELNELNKHRQLLTEQVLSEAKAQVELALDKKVLMAVGTDWPKGVVGLVAGKLLEEYNRPVLAISMFEGLATGSARSTPNFDMVAALNSAKDLLYKYGGHTQAAGFTLQSENLTDFHSRLLLYAESNNLTASDSVLEIDAQVEPSDISWKVYNLLEKLQPFGINNPKPKLAGYGFSVLDWRTVGANSQHLKLKLEFGPMQIEAIAFNKGYLLPTLSLGKKLDVVFELACNEYNGNRNLQLKILDVKYD